MKFITLVLTLLVTTGAGAGEATNSGPILLDFTATWCGPCQSMRPAVEELHRKGYPIRAVDIDQNPKLAERFGVTAVPTFIVVEPDGRVLARQSGACSAADLAALYRQGLARLQPRAELAGDDGPTTVRAQDPGEADESADESGGAVAEIPEPTDKPWLTVVRIKVANHYSHTIGFGSGTIIHSTADEAIILTCAHIFKIEEMGRRQPRPDQFPLKVAVDLFDGKLRESPTRFKTPYMLPSVTNIPAEVIDYDYVKDVGLIRIRTGRPLPYAKVVPPGWTPQLHMKMTTLGCSEGRPATAWSTRVTNPQTGLGNGYVGTECANAPMQGRSGGGLFTEDGRVAGVCDFNDGPGNHGLYASPSSIHRLLARNNLQVCWNTEAPRGNPDRALLARRDGDRPRPARNAPARPGAAVEPAKVLAQSPDPGDPIPMPSPEIMNVRLPRTADELAELDGEGSRTAYRWQPVASGRIELAETEVLSRLPERRRDADARPNTTRLEYDEDALDADLFLAAPKLESYVDDEPPARRRRGDAAAPAADASDLWRSAGPAGARRP
jgi:thiol-disulfide isomerase/thioredoxin